MKKRELKRIFMSFIAASAVLAACNGEEPSKQNEPTEQTEQANEHEQAQSEESLSIDQEVTAYKEMKAELEKMKEGQEVDWDLVLNTYQSDLQPNVNAINGDLDTTIQAAISAGTNGEVDENIARQLIDKVTQSYFYQKQKSLQKEAVALTNEQKFEEAKHTFEQIKHLINEVFIPTAEKRDNYYELQGESSLVENIQNGVALQEEALANENADDFAVYLQITDKSIYKSYYLAVNSYAEKIAKGIEEGTDEAELKIMQAEAYGFYQAIKGSLSSGDEEAAMKLDELFSLDKTKPSTINADEVNKLFIRAISGKVKGYHGKVPAALDEGVITEARVEALEGNMFLKMLEMPLKDILGEEKAQEAFQHAEEWYKAVEAGSKEEANTHSKAILQIVDELLS
jgi:hypothetical protein